VTAISYWVGSHRRTPAWTAVKHRNKEDDVRLLVDHMLPRFESWFGDGGQFSARLWWDYNQLKHDPAHAIDYTLVSVFTSAARLLLIGHNHARSGTSGRVKGHHRRPRIPIPRPR
jgi:hypothetical protein